MALINVVDKEVPENFTTAPESKLVPCTVNVVLGAPTVIKLGEIEVINKPGLTVKVLDRGLLLD